MKILAQLHHIYSIAFPDRSEWQRQPYQPTICGVRHALITLCLRFAEDLFPLAFSLDWLKRIIPGQNFDAGELAAIPIAPWGVDVIADPHYHFPDSFKPPLDFLSWGLFQETYRNEMEPDMLPACKHEMLLAHWQDSAVCVPSGKPYRDVKKLVNDNPQLNLLFGKQLFLTFSNRMNCWPRF